MEPETARPQRPKTLLIDSSSLIYRAFFSVPDTIRSPRGEPVHAAHGFLNMLARLVSDFRPERLACAWDYDWRPQWRVDLVAEYKSHRVAADGEEDPVEAQIALCARLLEVVGIAVVGAAGYEAEDVIGALLRLAPLPTAIVSGDRDLFQLVRDPGVWVLYPRRGVSDLDVVDEAEIERRYGIPGRAYADFAVLRGDPSDGLPGVRGIGPVGAAALIRKHGGLAEIVAAARSQGRPSGPLAKVAASLDYIERAHQVVRIAAEAPVGEPDLRLPEGSPNPDVSVLAEELGVEGPVNRLLAAIRGRTPG